MVRQKLKPAEFCLEYELLTAFLGVSAVKKQRLFYMRYDAAL